MSEEERERGLHGHFRAKPDSLGRSIGLRVRKDLEPLLAELAAEDGLTPTQWARKQVEAAIAERTIAKESSNESKKGG